MILTNINCSENCKYQKDGNCSFENINQKKITSHTDCAYFTPKNNLDNPCLQTK
jgi:hypothetical protein